MIDPGVHARGLSGSNGKPITIRALNDGQVFIDGQYIHRAVLLDQNNWFVIDGINAKNGVRNTMLLANSHNNIIRRSIFWDTVISKNNNTVGWDDSNNNLMEDVAIFGTGRKILNPYSQSTGNTFRRLWLRWEGSITAGPKYTLSLLYAGGVATNNTFENILSTWSGESMPQEYDLTDVNGNVVSPAQHFTNFNVQDRLTLFGRDHPEYGICRNIKLLGSLAYVKATTTTPPSTNMLIASHNDPADSRVMSCYTIKHVLNFWSPSHPSFLSSRGFNLGDEGTDNHAENLSSVSGRADIIPETWSPKNNAHATSLAGLNAINADPWIGTTGANLCKRWVNGVVTTEPLWPWPMNDRIKAATASAGRYTGPCPGCVGGRFVRTATDVTAEIQALLGPIPPQCRSS
jgi:hypothetical protein